MRTHNFVQTIGLLFALSSIALGQNTPPDVSNVAASQQGECGEVAVTYDLDDADGDSCTVWLAESEDGGASFNVPVLTLSSDRAVGPPSLGPTISITAGLRGGESK